MLFECTLRAFDFYDGGKGGGFIDGIEISCVAYCEITGCKKLLLMAEIGGRTGWVCCWSALAFTGCETRRFGGSPNLVTS